MLLIAKIMNEHITALTMVFGKNSTLKELEASI